MSDDVKAAAERLRQSGGYIPGYAAYRTDPDLFDADNETLAAAYLAEHSADDGEPRAIPLKDEK